MIQVQVISSTPITEKFPTFQAAEEYATFWRNRGYTATVR